LSRKTTTARHLSELQLDYPQRLQHIPRLKNLCPTLKNIASTIAGTFTTTTKQPEEFTVEHELSRSNLQSHFEAIAAFEDCTLHVAG
jgi:hypothetical protein